MPSPKLQTAISQALAEQPHLMGVYALNASQIEQIIAKVIAILGTLSTADCQNCISALVADVQSET